MTEDVRRCDNCGRKEGIVPFLSSRRTYNVVLKKDGPYLLCQWCRGVSSRT